MGRIAGFLFLTSPELCFAVFPPQMKPRGGGEYLCHLGAILPGLSFSIHDNSPYLPRYYSLVASRVNIKDIRYSWCGLLASFAG